jgi:GTP-binding protein
MAGGQPKGGKPQVSGGKTGGGTAKSAGAKQSRPRGGAPGSSARSARGGQPKQAPQPKIRPKEAPKALGAGEVGFVGAFTDALPPPTLPEVAVAGRSNVGKSSAINELLRRKGIARVSRTPGRTQTLNLFEVGGQGILVDLPGYGFAKVPEELAVAWRGFIERYLGDRPSLRLVIVLVDARHEAQPADVALVQGLLDVDIPICVVATKADKLTRNQLSLSLPKLAVGLGVPDILPISSLTGDGIAELRARIERAWKQKGD